MIINGCENSNVLPVLSYEQLLAHLGLEGTPSCTYLHSRFGKSGILHPGELLEVVTGTVIQMIHTDNA